MPRYFYTNMCMTGVLGVSDYCFTCVIEALSRATALEWGHHVAKVYNNRFGLLPNGGRLSEELIVPNSSISGWRRSDDVSLRLHHFCRVGELPDFPPGVGPA